MPRIDAAKTGRGRGAPGLVFSFVFGAAGLAGLPLLRAAGPAVGPDVMVLSFTDLGNYGVADGFAGYSIGTKACNRGDAPVDWCDTTGCGEGTSNRDHPVIAQNLYRLRGGRFEQIGMSWLKHGHVSTNTTSAECAAAAGGTCVEPPLGADQLGVGCTDSYTSSLNGNRPLGRRSEVNAASGDFPYPYTRFTATGPYEQRIKAAVADVDPAVNPMANVLRWSSTFSFWFDATVAPANSFVHHLGLFEPGSPAAVTFRFLHPLFEDGFETGDTTSWSASSP